MALFEGGRDCHTEPPESWATPRNERSPNQPQRQTTGSAQKLASMASVPLHVAEDHLRGNTAQYPQWAAWKRDVVQAARSGELLDNGFGRELRSTPTVPGPPAPPPSDKPAPATCSWKACSASTRRSHPHLRCVVHDEAVLSVPAEAYHDIAHQVLDCLTLRLGPTRGQPHRPHRGHPKRPGRNWSHVYE